MWSVVVSRSAPHKRRHARFMFHPACEYESDSLLTTPSIISGFDMDARPLIYMRPGRENTETSPRQIRHLIYNLCV